MIPRISVVMPTMRIGGMDMTRAGLSNQTFKDFELIIVDKHYRHRHEQVMDYFSGVGVTHIPPHTWKVHGDGGVVFNTGISLARGELVVFLGDYTYVHPTWLQEHWQTYVDFQKRGTLVGLRCRIGPPILKPDLQIGTCPISCFAKEFKGLNGGLNGVIRMREQKPALFLRHLFGLYYEAPWHDFLLGCNEALPKKLLDEIGGVDEEYDGGSGYQDSDLGFRAVAAGHLLVLNKSFGVPWKVEVREFLPEKWVMGERYNYGILERKVERILPGLKEQIRLDGLTCLQGVDGNATIRKLLGRGTVLEGAGN